MSSQEIVTELPALEVEDIARRCGTRRRRCGNGTCVAAAGMRFLVDENLSPVIATGLREAGHGAAHARDLGLAGASDSVVLERVHRADRVVVSAAPT